MTRNIIIQINDSPSKVDFEAKNFDKLEVISWKYKTLTVDMFRGTTRTGFSCKKIIITKEVKPKRLSPQKRGGG